MMALSQELAPILSSETGPPNRSENAAAPFTVVVLLADLPLAGWRNRALHRVGRAGTIDA